MSSTHNSRASLLAGLRTGGVRSAAQPAFSLPHFPSQSQPSLYPDEDDLPPFVDSNPHPLTAAVDGSNNRFAHQQVHSALNPNSAPFSPTFFSQNALPQNQLQNQAFQRQLLQLEMMRIQAQAVQAQQIQAELLAQAQRQHQQQQAQAQAQVQARERRTSLGFTNAPATAGPHVTAFDLRSATLSAQMRRANQAEQLRAQLGLTPPAEDQVPMTAALGGRFGGRMASASTHLSRYIPEGSEEYAAQLPPTPGSTTVIAGGTYLCNSTSNNANVTTNALPSRSDQVSNWRRPGNNVGVSHRAVSSPAVRITPPPFEHQRISPPPGITVTGPIAKGRPQPLNILPVASQPLATVAIDNTDSTEEDDISSSVRSSSISSPTTPRSSSSSTNYESQLSPREEATKKLFEGLGIDRPVTTNGTGQPQHFHILPLSHAHPHSAQAHSHRMVSQPTRQPRGPPSGADELGPKNFATRIRRQAIGGLGMLMGARERRESFVEAY